MSKLLSFIVFLCKPRNVIVWKPDATETYLEFCSLFSAEIIAPFEIPQNSKKTFFSKNLEEKTSKMQLQLQQQLSMQKSNELEMLSLGKISKTAIFWVLIPKKKTFPQTFGQSARLLLHGRFRSKKF